MGGGALALAGGGAVLTGLRRMGSMKDYGDAVASARSLLSQHPEIRDLVRYATLAPNGHNTQPWQFRLAAGRIEVLPDFSRRTPAVDPDDHHLFVSLGCAAETLALAARARGKAGELSFDPAGDGSVAFTFKDGSAVESALFDAITKRQSTRAEYDGRQVSPDDLRMLTEAAAVPGIDLHLLTDKPQLDRMRDLVVAGNSAQMADADFMRELLTWLRFSPRQAAAMGDGLFSATSGSPPLPDWLGPRAFQTLFTTAAENDKYARQIRSSAGMAVFVAEQADADHWVRAGRACQRFALQATALGLKHAFINQPVEVASLRPELATLVGQPERRPDIVMRFGYGGLMPFSARRQPEQVMI